MNNVYLYQVDGGPTYFIPWDKDHAFWAVGPSGTAGQEHVIRAKMLGTPETRLMYADALQAIVAAAATDDWLSTTISGYYELVREAAHADQRKRYDNDVFEAAVADLLVLAHARFDTAQEDLLRLRTH